MIKISKDLSDRGIKIACHVLKKRKPVEIKIPLFLNPVEWLKDILPDEMEALNVLEGLWQEGILQEENNFYVIPYEFLYNIAEDQRCILCLPVEDNSIKVHIKAKGILGSSDFALIPDIYIKDEKMGPLDRRIKNVVSHNGSLYLIPLNLYSLLNEIDAYKPTADPLLQAKIIAKVKYKAKSANVTFDKFLESEEVYYSEKLDVDIVKHSDDHIQIVPVLGNEIDSLLKDSKDKVLKQHNTLYGEGIKRKRIFLEDRVVQNYNKILRQGHLKGTQIPRFLTDPYSILPENIDLSNFSKRVKELGLKVYRANPYINIKRDKNSGWFDFEIGGIIHEDTGFGLDEDGDYTRKNELKDNAKIDVEEYRHLVQKAVESGEDYVNYKGNWIKIDREQASRFLNIVDNEQFRKTQRIDITRLPYVLKIYENIENLEYNETALSLKKQLTGNFSISDFRYPMYLKNCQLYEHQKEGFLWFKGLYENHMGGLLADDMGLGKTLQIISFLCYLKECNEIKPTLIIAPYTLLDVWESEIRKFSEITSVYRHTGYKRYKTPELLKNYEITLTTYETLVRDQLLLGQIDWQAVVCDEAQKIKNSTTLTTSAVKALKARIKIAMTGTPVENNLGELWCIIDYVQPGLLSSYHEFRKTYQIPIEDAISNRSEAYVEVKNKLLNTIRPVYLRRVKDGILSLPAKNEFFLEVELTALQEKVYCQLIEDYKNKGKSESPLGVLQKLMELCAHPRLVRDEGEVNTFQLLSESGKLQRLIELLNEIKRRGEKAVIFTHYIKMQAILRKVIMDVFGINCPVINGNIKGDRMSIIDRFKESSGFGVIILSTRAAGVGVTITEANNVIHYTRDWNPAVEKQATDRVYRIGQTREVNIYYPICISSRGKTVEERLNEVLQKKLQLLNEVIVPSRCLSITEENYDYLLQDFSDWSA
ncbi:LOW QUALITY PROTEIN: SNF2-related protein [Thermoanaerobacter wiegelii Rt8.B1]|uniref:SNF2-related protein n=2 Tax=Thermoanaerobacter TaxID=1754 RepID=G2MV69_9THEO|nr:LOW QUALITY PROTEIN: SNF2-related protein [Thermoanaerobacter wiegelii Rt8.B1]